MRHVSGSGLVVVVVRGRITSQSPIDAPQTHAVVSGFQNDRTPRGLFIV